MGEPFKMVESIHSIYTDKFGVKNSFYRFINEVLPSEVREALFYSIQISYVHTFTNKDSNGVVVSRGAEELKKMEDDALKIKFLFRIRNEYTHRAISTGSPSGGVFENGGRSWMHNGVMLYGWSTITAQPTGIEDHYYYYDVRKWPEVLIEIVEAGLAQRSSVP